MKVQYVSDLHLEFYDNYTFENFIKPSAEILFLLGDIGDPDTMIYKNFIQDCSIHFNKVFLIAGNHEYYSGKNINDINLIIQNICSSYDNVIFLNNDFYELTEDYVLLGTTLWSNLSQNEMVDLIFSSNDFLKIKNDGKNLDFNMVNFFFKNNVRWLEDNLKKMNNKKIIILSHHLPSYKCINKKYNQNRTNSAYASNLDYLFSKYNINYWFFGHTHTSVDMTINRTVLICNPMGYIRNIGKENEQYNDSLFVELQ